MGVFSNLSVTKNPLFRTGRNMASKSMGKMKAIKRKYDSFFDEDTMIDFKRDAEMEARHRKVMDRMRKQGIPDDELL